MGYCLTFLPTVTILSQYFTRRRALVTAVASTGESLFMSALAPGECISDCFPVRDFPKVTAVSFPKVVYSTTKIRRLLLMTFFVKCDIGYWCCVHTSMSHITDSCKALLYHYCYVFNSD